MYAGCFDERCRSKVTEKEDAATNNSSCIFKSNQRSSHNHQIVCTLLGLGCNQLASCSNKAENQLVLYGNEVVSIKSRMHGNKIK